MRSASEYTNYYGQSTSNTQSKRMSCKTSKRPARNRTICVDAHLKFRVFTLVLCSGLISLTANAFVSPRTQQRLQSLFPESTSNFPHHPSSSLTKTHTRNTRTFIPQQPSVHTKLYGIKGFRSWFESQFPDAIFAMDRNEARHEFDHVLIDVNQLLHIALRRSRSEGHALTLLMKELDSCCTVATPKRSVVLALDGPPSAAKLATQRRRRYSTVVRTDWKQQQLTYMIQRGSSTISKQEEAKKRRRYVTETKTLCITPGTQFMEKAHQAILYWAWQRLSNPNNHLSNVRVYLSPSTVAGEGEVKLLDWILQQQVRPGEHIAILGGDSDLVLEGLVIPPSITHNVHVLLPDGNKRYLAVSLWEATRALARFLPKLNAKDMMRVRTDLVLLLIMNGNDYLPKLRGSSGFNKLFHNYLRVLHQWLNAEQKPQSVTSGASGHGVEHEPFLVDPDSLEINLPFAVAFFRHLAHLAPDNLWDGRSDSSSKNRTKDGGDEDDISSSSLFSSQITPLSQLNNLVEAGFMPQPMAWSVFAEASSSTLGNRGEITGTLQDATGYSTSGVINNGMELIPGVILENEVLDEKDLPPPTRAKGNADGTNEDEDDEEGEQWLIRLNLGEEGTDQYYTYEVWHDPVVPLKKSKQHLASLALEEIMGADLSDLDSNDLDVDDMDDDFFGGGITSSGYSWEVKHSVPGKVDKYLYGLLWNLQTYQDGVCADYAYNYGRRMSPTASEIVKFLKDAMENNRTVGPEELSGGNTFHPPVSAGLSCLAALPSQVNDLVPEPYQWLAINNTVEELYARCMDPEDNVFDINRFQQLCEERIERMTNEKNENGNQSSWNSNDDMDDNDFEEDAPGEKGNNNKYKDNVRGRRIITGDHYWTVVGRLPKSTPPLEHPFKPPPPFSDRLSYLRSNRRMKVSRAMATMEPLQRSAKGHFQKHQYVHRRKGVFTKGSSVEISHADLGNLLKKKNNGKDELSITDVAYKKAYKSIQDAIVKKKKRKKIKIDLNFPRVKGGKDLPSSSPAPLENGKQGSTASRGSTSSKKSRHRIEFDVAERMKQFNIVNPPKDPATNIEGFAALQCLQQLKDSGLIGDIEWCSKRPSGSDYARFNPNDHESIQVIIQKGGALDENLIYEQDRDINAISRKMIRQHLANFALCDLMGPQKRWSEMTYKEMKSFLLEKMES